MSLNNTTNYQEHGGAEWVVGGTLRVAAGGRIVADDGGQAEAIADADTAVGDAPDDDEFDALVAKFNALLAACRGVGIIAAE